MSRSKLPSLSSSRAKGAAKPVASAKSTKDAVAKTPKTAKAPLPSAPISQAATVRLSNSELDVLGGAFSYGYEAVRAKRLHQPGLGVTAADDLSLSLGFPMLVELGPDVSDPAAYARDRISKPLRRLEPWPRNAAVRAARAIAGGWVRFPAELKPASEKALADGSPIVQSEVATLLGMRFAVIPAAWRHMLELIFLLEALAGGEAVLAAGLGEIGCHPNKWSTIDMTRHSVVISLGLVSERLSAARAAPFRGRFGALLEQYQAEDPTLSDPETEMVPLRALDLILNGAEAYERSALRDEDGPDKNFCALFLETRDYERLTKGKPPTYSTPSVQWIVQGGPAEYAQLPDWSKVEAQGSKDESQRYFVGQWARVALPGTAILLADMFQRSAAKAEVVTMTERGIARLGPLLDVISADVSQPNKIRNAAKALIAAARPRRRRAPT